jgi:hypothetical protein
MQKDRKDRRDTARLYSTSDESGGGADDALVQARTGLMWEQRGWPEGAVRRMA